MIAVAQHREGKAAVALAVMEDHSAAAKHHSLAIENDEGRCPLQPADRHVNLLSGRRDLGVELAAHEM